jgi:hypothetical protein
MKPEEMALWHWTRAGRRFRQRVVDPLSHEEYRRMIRETYPAQLPPEGSGWFERFGHEVIKVRPDPEVVAHAHRLLERARRAGTVAVDWAPTFLPAMVFIAVMLRPWFVVDFD